MRWAITEFTHFTGDEAMFESLADEDFWVIEAETLSEVLERLAVRNGGGSLARIDDGDSPYGGVYTDARAARRYFKLNDFVLSNTSCYAVFAESVLDRNFDAMQQL